MFTFQNTYDQFYKDLNDMDTKPTKSKERFKFQQFGEVHEIIYNTNKNKSRLLTYFKEET